MKEINPFFSIIIPTYNRALLIGRTIQSLLNQTYSNFELIIIDDGGSDNTEEVVRNFKSEKIQYYWKENAERGAARNFGARLSKGQILNFFDSDDIALPNHLETAYQFYSEPQNLSKIFHSSYQFVFEDKVLSHHVKDGELNSTVRVKNSLSCNNVFIPTSIFKQYRFSENRGLSGTEDWELWIRLSMHHSIIGSKIITSSIINHENRSMVIATGKTTELRTINLYSELKKNQIEEQYLKNIHGEMLSLTSLHYALENAKTKSIKFLISAIQYYPKTLYTRRFLAILKHLFFPKEHT